MTAQHYHFNDVTLLVTHYNRSKSLARLLKSFEDVHITFGDIVISDDGSSAEHISAIEQLQAQYNFRLVTTPVNRGLGNNINKGQDAVNTPYTLYIQEDFTVKPVFPEHFLHAVDMLRNDSRQWDMISLYAYEKYPYSKPYKYGFSEKIYEAAPWYTNNLKFYLYSDHPHLRRSDFFRKFGRYAEGINGDQTEMRMSLSFIRHKGKSLLYDHQYDLLTQENSADEPSTATFRKTLKDNGSFPVVLAKWLYARFKFVKLNLQLLQTK